MTHKDKVREAVLRYGFRIGRWANMEPGSFRPTVLAKQVRRVETWAHRQAEFACGANDIGDYDTFTDRVEATVTRRLSRIFGPANAARVRVNFDPRGYALKTEDDPRSDLARDWGGYSLLAPDVTE